MALKISNRQGRRLLLQAQGLGTAPTGNIDLARIIHDLGFVQLDTIRVVLRAHDHILWSRNNNYRPRMLDRLMRARGIFEHFTHDASVLPMEFYRVWQRQLARKTAEIDRKGWYTSMPDAKGRAEIKARIAAEGPLSTHDFDTKVDGKKEMWARPPHKLGLDYMWYSGELSTCHRKGFTKFYDLTERVIPADMRGPRLTPEQEVDWLCDAALRRMCFGSLGEIRTFWDASDVAEVKAWADRTELVPVEVECADGRWVPGWSLPDIEQQLEMVSAPTQRLRILNPFDPVIRNRDRLERLFGFEYRVEMFVPAAKRIWGYYVYPLLEGERFVGRIEVKADRNTGCLNVLNLWWEPGVRQSKARQDKLMREVERLARASSCETLGGTELVV